MVGSFQIMNAISLVERIIQFYSFLMSVLLNCAIQRICLFNISCQVYSHKAAHNILLLSFLLSYFPFYNKLNESSISTTPL